MRVFTEYPSLTLGFLNNPTAMGLLLLVVVVLFGGKNIPELMKGVGQGMREFKKGMEHEHEDEDMASARIAHQEDEARLRARIEEEVRARIKAEKEVNHASAPPTQRTP